MSKEQKDIAISSVETLIETCYRTIGYLKDEIYSDYVNEDLSKEFIEMLIEVRKFYKFRG
jgi:hypothetical protein